MGTRKSIRLKNFDYSSHGAYFITICTQNRQCSLSTISVGQGLCSCRLSPLGQVVAEEIGHLSSRFPSVLVEKSVIMPNHIHLLLMLNNDPYQRQEQSPCPTVGAVVCALKSLSTKRANAQDSTPGRKIWHTRYHDRVIRNEKSYRMIWEYIHHNPSTWEKDKFYPPSL